MKLMKQMRQINPKVLDCKMLKSNLFLHCWKVVCCALDWSSPFCRAWSGAVLAVRRMSQLTALYWTTLHTTKNMNLLTGYYSFNIKTKWRANQYQNDIPKKYKLNIISSIEIFERLLFLMLAIILIRGMLGNIF